MTSLLSKLFLVGIAAAAVAIPPLKARVTDLTNTLNASQRSALEQTLAEFEARKGSQIAVLIVPTTQPETVDQYAVRVQESWKLGRKGVDDGVLLVVAKDDRKLHIETGYGVEGVLPDAAAKRIIEDDITPRFKQGDFYGGIRAGTDRIMRTIEGEPLPPPASSRAAADRRPDIVEWLFPLFFLFLLGGAILKMIFGRFIGGSLTGGILGLAVWLLFGSFVGALVVGVIAFFFSLLSGIPSGRGVSSRWGGDSGWGSGGWSGGGGSSGGGGFSGGGGSSGGGGASGSW